MTWQQSRLLRSERPTLRVDADQRYWEAHIWRVYVRWGTHRSSDHVLILRLQKLPGGDSQEHQVDRPCLLKPLLSGTFVLTLHGHWLAPQRGSRRNNENTERGFHDIWHPRVGDTDFFLVPGCPYPFHTFPKDWRLTHSKRPALTWYQSQTKTQENYTPITLMNIKCNSIPANEIQQHTKTIMYHDQVWFIPGMQRWFHIWKSINAICQINRMKGEKYPHVVISTDVEKTFDKIQYDFMIKNIQQMRQRRKLPQ